mgnify:CR=1 FL=1
MDRRDFLKGAAALGAAAALPAGMLGSAARAATARRPSWIDHPAAECPVDTVVMLYLENRSFDHMLGWLGADEAYLEQGRSRYGKGFAVNARTHETYRAADGRDVATYSLVDSTLPNPWRGCGHKIPGHGWNAGRVQLEHGFLAAGSDNDPFAVGYFRKQDLPLYAALATNYTVSDAHFASLLGETIPNRLYIHSATSDGLRDNPGPLTVGMWHQETIWDRLERAGVSARFYYSDFPYLLGFGERMSSRLFPIEQFLEDCAAGTLPHFAFVAPQFGGPFQSDGHPRSDVNMAQRFATTMFRAFAQSPQWATGMFTLAHDEWGGFWDHVRPPQFADSRSSSNLDDDFGQAGFRVPAITASPWVAQGAVSSVPVDHTGHLRFLEWRFLGAPARGTRGRTKWWLTTRDRHSHNVGAMLTQTSPQLEVPFDLELEIPLMTPACADEGETAVRDDAKAMQMDPSMTEYVSKRHPPSSTDSWSDPTHAVANPTTIGKSGSGGG